MGLIDPIAGADVGVHPSMVPMIAAALFLQIAAASSPEATVAITLSGVSIISVGTLVFKAGEWRGEHKALQQKVNEQFLVLQKSIDDKFHDLREDMREMRQLPST